MIEIPFRNPVERREVHQYIRETAREIEENTEVLQNLFILENGVDKHSEHGFGHVENNYPERATVTFGMDMSEFIELLDNIQDATFKEIFGEQRKHEEQLHSLVNDLKEAISEIKESSRELE